MDLTPIVPPGRQLIERYGPSGFRISGLVHQGPVLVFPDVTVAWPAVAADRVDLASLQPVIEHGGVEILLLGLGRRFRAPPPRLRSELRAVGGALEAMDTGAACRTYNVLLAEDRPVAAALLPPV